MSVRALTWSFALPLQDMAAKAVLHALADHADEDGKCWPSLRRIALFAGCSENTARRALQRVEVLGIVRRDQRAGQSDMFFLNMDFDPSHAGTPPTVGPLPTERPPLPPWDPTPPKLAGDPSQRGTRTTKEPPENRQSTTRGDDAKPERLPGDWRPSTNGRTHAVDLGLDPSVVAESFTDYFTEGKGKRETRTAAGWEKRWRIWCNRDAARPLGAGQARAVRPVRGNDAVYEQLARIAARDEN